MEDYGKLERLFREYGEAIQQAVDGINHMYGLDGKLSTTNPTRFISGVGIFNLRKYHAPEFISSLKQIVPELDLVAALENEINYKKLQKDEMFQRIDEMFQRERETDGMINRHIPNPHPDGFRGKK